MIASMTAFAREQTEHDWGTLIWEIRTVNHRFLEPGFKLPESLKNLEPKLREHLRSTISRGKCDAQLRFLPNSGAQPSLHLNEALLRQLHQASRHISTIMTNAAAVNPLEVLQWPGVIQEQEQNLKEIEEHALRLFTRTLDSLVAQRQREGEELVGFIQRRLASVSAIVQQIRVAMPGILARQQEKISAQLAQLEIDADAGRLEQEIVLVTQKADIHEEVDRLDTHVKEVTRVLMQEDTDRNGSAILAKDKATVGENIRRAGEDVKEGEVVIPKGRVITPALVGMMAVCGRSSVLVGQRPTVAILSTGDELCELDEVPEGSQIF
ncbi:MAG: YicC/YloC family endoribonuclease, partial [Pseudomonadales bacterium]|nr:YicC/YloC family endoribonuclease [Pseudomonadales bacterium]